MILNRRAALKRLAITGSLIFAGPVRHLIARTPFRTGSNYFRFELNPDFPQFDYFSVDSLGKSKLDLSPLLPIQGAKTTFISETRDGVTRYFTQRDRNKAAWEFIPSGKGFILRSNFTGNNTSWIINFNQRKNHATVLGLVPEKNKISTPCLIHLPDMGSVSVRSKQVKSLDYLSKRMNVTTPFVRISFPAADEENRTVEYHFEITAIYPDLKEIAGDSRFDGYRRNFINTFQVNPELGMLSNNSSSDSCAFVQYGYSEIALHAPKLVGDLKAIDLVGMTVDRYLSGDKGYGIKGYVYDSPGTELVEWGGQSGSLDAFPSLLISACNYFKGSQNQAWLEKNFHGLKRWAVEIVDRDCDGDGIIEYGFSGNSGSWSGGPEMRPANWWDTIGFGHKDAYSNCLAYRALKEFSGLCRETGESGMAEIYNGFAEKLKSNYYNTFYNPDTGVLAGWKSADGELHDYYFIFVNSLAIAYGLVNPEQGNRIMDAMLAKMEEVGFDNFELGLPGNLIPVKRADYTHHDPRWGGNTTDELNDGWQKYENGGTSGNYVYFTLSALYRLGRKKDAERILFPLLKGLEEGIFQGECKNGMTKDWRTWDGECWGYEGFLVDNYWSVLAVAENYK